MSRFGKHKKEKIFCIGANKTGTTSLEKALTDLGYKMGDQRVGELLFKEYAHRNFKPIIDFCYTADAFQDAPFSFQHTFIPLDQHFPNAKFILTVRDSESQWYDSLIRFHNQLFKKGEGVPTMEDLKNVPYHYKGFVWEVRNLVFGFQEEDDPYDREVWIRHYRTHNAAVRDYFRNKTNFLEINLSDIQAYQKMCEFLRKDPLYDSFPWENKSYEKA